jgi:biopolymer transport protein TolQ
VYSSLFGGAALELLSVNLLDAIWNSDLVGLACVLVLTGYSFYAWFVICAKWYGLRQIARENAAFKRACGRDGTLEGSFFECRRFEKSVLANLLRVAYVEIHSENWFADCADLPIEQRLNVGRNSIERSVERAINDQITELDAKMVGLGGTAAVAPFIGLFGTVWGVLGAFQSIASSGAADITALAPGISTALITTIFGLFAAIPAVIAYNLFTVQISRLTAEMDSYALDLNNVFQREMLRRSTLGVAA